MMFGLSKREVSWTVNIAHLKDMVQSLSQAVNTLEIHRVTPFEHRTLRDEIRSLGARVCKLEEAAKPPADPITYCKECGVAFLPKKYNADDGPWRSVLLSYWGFSAMGDNLRMTHCSRCLPDAHERQRIIDYATANPEKVKPCVDAATAPKRKRK
jgi:hypothetical protein